MSPELKYIMNTLPVLMNCPDKKLILRTNGEKFQNNNKEFLSPHTNLPEMNSSRLIVPRLGSEWLHKVTHSRWGE